MPETSSGTDGAIMQNMINNEDREAVDAELSDLPAPAKSRKFLVIGASIAVVIAAGAATWVYGLPMITSAVSDPVYVEIPTMLVSIKSPDGKARFLKVRIVLETTSQAKASIEARLPAAVDSMQNFLREVRPEDMSGTSAMFRLKEEMLVRAQRTLGAGQIKDVLIQELVQQ